MSQIKHNRHNSLLPFLRIQRLHLAWLDGLLPCFRENGMGRPFLLWLFQKQRTSLVRIQSDSKNINEQLSGYGYYRLRITDMVTCQVLQEIFSKHLAFPCHIPRIFRLRVVDKSDAQFHRNMYLSQCHIFYWNKKAAVIFRVVFNSIAYIYVGIFLHPLLLHT